MRTKLLNLFTILSIVLFTSCSEESELSSNTKYYQIVNNMSYYYSSYDSYLNGTMYEVVVFQYDESGDVIQQDNLPDIKYGGGKSSVTKADSYCVKVQVSFKMLPEESSYYNLSANSRKYIVANAYLTGGEIATITLDDETMVSTSRTRSAESISIEDLLLNFE